MNRRLWTGLGVAVVLFGIVGCSATGDAEESTPSADPGAAQEADVSDVPDVVAEVNGVEISGEDFIELYEGQFAQLAAQAQATGEEVDQESLRSQTAEAMVDTELLSQEADERGIEPSQTELDAALEEIAAANQMESTDDVLSALGEQGLSEDDVYSQLTTQVQQEQLLAEEVGDAEPTEEELRELYDQAVAQQEQSGEEGAEIPPFEEVEPQIREQAVSTAQSEAYAALVGELREDADITVHL
ncbi:MAG: SurA N-terminal domain-containing protein [Actinomycetota bacterium]